VYQFDVKEQELKSVLIFLNPFLVHKNDLALWSLNYNVKILQVFNNVHVRRSRQIVLLSYTDVNSCFSLLRVCTLSGRICFPADEFYTLQIQICRCLLSTSE